MPQYYPRPTNTTTSIVFQVNLQPGSVGSQSVLFLHYLISTYTCVRWMPLNSDSERCKCKSFLWSDAVQDAYKGSQTLDLILFIQYWKY